jgi:hypothetical protein
MSIIKKCDVAAHFAERRRKRMFPFTPMSEPDATGYSGNEPHSAKGNAPGSGAGSSWRQSGIEVSNTPSKVSVISDASTLRNAQV